MFKYVVTIEQLTSDSLHDITNAACQVIGHEGSADLAAVQFHSDGTMTVEFVVYE